MEDKFDTIMRDAAREADASVDYAAMHDAVLTQAGEKRRRERSTLRILSTAAGLVIIAGVGAAFLFPAAKSGTPDAAGVSDAPAPMAAALTEEAAAAESEDSGVIIQTVPAEEPASEESMPEPSDGTGMSEEGAQEELPVYDDVVPIPSCACQYFEYVGLPAAQAFDTELSGQNEADSSGRSAALSAEPLAAADIEPDLLAALAVGEAYVDGDSGEAVWRIGEDEYMRIWGETDDIGLLAFMRSLCE